MATIRVKHGISCVMFRPEGTVVLSSGAPFEDTDPIVRDNPDMFTYDVDAEAGDSVRVTGGKRDDLQAAMAVIRKDVPDLPLSFNNFRD